MNKSKLFNTPQIAPGVLPGVKAEDLPVIKCTCGAETFIDAWKITFASSFQSATGIPTLVKNPQGFMCSECGKINQFDVENLPISEGDKKIVSHKDIEKNVKN